MNEETCRPSRLDSVLGVVLRVLLCAVCALGGAWLSKAVPLLGRLALPGAVAGLAIAFLALLMERRILAFCSSHAAWLSLSAFVLYVILLGLATYSELFNLGWFDWLGM